MRHCPPTLEHLDVRQNNVVHTDLSALSHLTNLQACVFEPPLLKARLTRRPCARLSLGGNALPTLGALPALPRLERLHMTCMSLRDLAATVVALRRLPALRRLHLEGNPLCYRQVLWRARARARATD